MRRHFPTSALSRIRRQPQRAGRQQNAAGLVCQERHLCLTHEHPQSICLDGTRRIATDDDKIRIWPLSSPFWPCHFVKRVVQRPRVHHPPTSNGIHHLTSSQPPAQSGPSFTRRLRKSPHCQNRRRCVRLLHITCASHPNPNPRELSPSCCLLVSSIVNFGHFKAA